MLIEYGGDHVIDSTVENFSKTEFEFIEDSYDISVSRAQEDMNIHILIEAYKNVSDRNLVIISNWSTSNYGMKLYEKNYNKYQNIHLIDAIYDKEKLNALRRNASLYLHSHSLCGTAPSLVEAMNLSLPVVAFDARQ